jgi:hypothetical protein
VLTVRTLSVLADRQFVLVAQIQFQCRQPATAFVNLYILLTKLVREPDS